MNFKPTKWKVIVSVVVVIVWILALNFLTTSIICKICQMPVCDADYDNWMIKKPICDCSCQTFNEMLFGNLSYIFYNIIFPFALVYIIWSLIQKPGKNKIKKK